MRSQAFIASLWPVIRYRLPPERGPDFDKVTLFSWGLSACSTPSSWGNKSPSSIKGDLSSTSQHHLVHIMCIIRACLFFGPILCFWDLLMLISIAVVTHLICFYSILFYKYVTFLKYIFLSTGILSFAVFSLLKNVAVSIFLYLLSACT